MKIPKMGKKTARKIVRGCSLIMYAFGVAVYGYLNYKEGVLSEWDYLSNAANEKEYVSIYNEDTDDHYLMFGKDRTKKIYDNVQESRNEKESE